MNQPRDPPWSPRRAKTPRTPARDRSGVAQSGGRPVPASASEPAIGSSRLPAMVSPPDSSATRIVWACDASWLSHNSISGRTRASRIATIVRSISNGCLKTGARLNFSTLGVHLNLNRARSLAPRHPHRRGWGRAQVKVAMGDGAAWIRNICEEQFPGAIQIVDLNHARQHLWDLGSKPHPDNENSKRRWVMSHRHLVDHG